MATLTRATKSDIAPATPTTPAHLLELAINSNLDIDKLERLIEMQRSWQKEEARKAFFNAMNQFQASVPEIRKNKKVAFNKTEYAYAPLADIVRQIKNTAKDCGLSYRWEIQPEGDQLKVTCLITHLDGHTESTTMIGPADTTGSKNAIQARGSAIEYLKRYTLIGALGLSTTDSDVDGQVSETLIDELHQEYMKLYDSLILVDTEKYQTKAHPDAWGSRSAKTYQAAIKHAVEIIAQHNTRKS